jgi:hypothetical protein
MRPGRGAFLVLLKGEQMTEQNADQPADQFRPDRREHAKASERLDDEQLARQAEEERVAAGLDAYDPDEVPAATDSRPTPDVTQTEQYQEERAEIRREVDAGELGPGSERESFPPTRYDRS